VTGRRKPLVNLAHALGAPCTAAGAFFVPAVLCHGGCVWAGFGLAGFPSFPVFLPRTQLPPNPVGRIVAAPTKTWSLMCEHNPHLSFRNTAGIHQAIRIISRLASEQCGKTSLLQGETGDEKRSG